MKKRALTPIELIGIIFLILVALGVSWYFFFYSPLQNEIVEINAESDTLDQKIQLAQTKLAKMNSMQKELDEIFAASSEPSEIAVYDNSQAVMTQLDGILSTTQEYSLSFSNPSPDVTSGIVRRSVSLTYNVNSYAEAKNILLALEKNHWRCIITSVSISGGSEEAGVISNNPTTVNALLIFFESTNIKATE